MKKHRFVESDIVPGTFVRWDDRLEMVTSLPYVDTDESSRTHGQQIVDFYIVCRDDNTVDCMPFTLESTLHDWNGTSHVNTATLLCRGEKKR